MLFYMTIKTKTSFETKFWCPKGLAVDDVGHVYVACAVRKGGALKFRYYAGTLQEPEEQWAIQCGALRGMAMTTDGRFLATHSKCSIDVFSPSGEIEQTWGTAGSEPGQFAGPCGMAVDGAGAIYIVESGGWGKKGGCRVQVFSPEYTFLREWGEKGTEPGRFNLPADLAIDDQGRVFVLDSYNCRVQIFSPKGVFIDAWGAYGAAQGNLNCPQGMAFDRAGHLYIADTYNNRIQKFTADGRFLAKWCAVDGCNFWLPCAVTLDSEDRLLIADTMNQRIHILEL